MIRKKYYVYARVTYSRFDALIEWYGVYVQNIPISCWGVLIKIASMYYYDLFKWYYFDNGILWNIKVKYYPSSKFDKA